MKKNQVLSNEVLLNNSCELTVTANSLDIIIRMISDLECSRISGDIAPIDYQVNKGLFDALEENLTNIKENIEKVSDAICPDYLEETK